MQYYLKIEEKTFLRYAPVLLQEYINFEGLGIFQTLDQDVKSFSYGRLVCEKVLDKYLHLFPPEKEILVNQCDENNNEKFIKLVVTGIVKSNICYYIYVKGA